ncbi:hypothetical protein L484_020808 [Morus notabilis]|uniref:Uncharacterized protein n=1 Tax=Morus notabilis TaxID=981085 RepID=W9R2I4_9ROSA|nr:uncharacterized protein LOC21403688 [Morus notabilis]EXB37022.1 hypothetical protein L484_020808 [Morus notabilis]
MKGTSKVIMGATLVMVVGLAMVLGLILVLLAELYCSLLLRRRQLKISTTNAATASAAADSTAEAETAASSSSRLQDQSPEPTPSPLSSFHAQGVLQAPRSLLFPAISFKEDCLQTKKKLSQLRDHHQVIDIPKQEHNHVGMVSNSTPSPSISFVPSPQRAEEEKTEGGNVTSTSCNEKTCGDGGKEHFVYISNPIYENIESGLSGSNTPFETPDTSPSRLEMGGSDSSSSSSGEDEIAKPSSLTPPLTPMKKLPAEGCSVSLRDARSLGTSGSDSNSNNGHSSSSSGSPCTSPSW